MGSWEMEKEIHYVIGGGKAYFEGFGKF